MRARRVGTGSEYHLFQDEQGIGWVNSAAVGFRGFATPDEAALAGSSAYHALGKRRAAAARPRMWCALQGNTGIYRRMRQFADA